VRWSRQASVATSKDRLNLRTDGTIKNEAEKNEAEKPACTLDSVKYVVRIYFFAPCSPLYSVAKTFLGR